MHGLYAAYFAGLNGNSLGLFYIGNDVIAGVDVGGSHFDGRLTPSEDGGLEGLLEFEPGGDQKLITGVAVDAIPKKIPVKIKLPSNFATGVVIRIETPIGPLNARFEKLKDLPPL